MALDTGDWVKIIAAAVGLAYPLLEKLWKAGKEAQESAPPTPRPKPQPRPAAKPAPKPVPQQGARPSNPAAAPSRAGKDPFAAQTALAASLDKLAHDATALGEPLRQEPANHRFVNLLTEWLPREARALREVVLRGGPELQRDHVARSTWLAMVLEEVEVLVRQRRDGDLLPLLGDADALAETCYRPVIAFAKAEGLPLASATPVTQLSPIDLSIWTGFAPTSVAPIFLPPTFFETVWHWPAVAHEIGHDFLISIEGLRDKLAEELGLPAELRGLIPLQLQGNQLPSSELWRLYGGWLEELFCDVFGTLMCGPAYAETMVELFSFEEDPREAVFVPFDPRMGRYDPHPPRHLRVHASCQVLERAGFHEDARRIRARWFERNELDPDQETALLFWVAGSYIYLPHSAFEPLTQTIVDRLYAGPLQSLNGFGLQDISGLDYGPREHAEAQRAREALLGGRVPAVRDARAIIAGAVLAAVEARDRHTGLLELARRAIRAVGTHEQVPSAFDLAAPRVIGALDLSSRAVAESLVLKELMERRRPRLSRPLRRT